MGDVQDAEFKRSQAVSLIASLQDEADRTRAQLGHDAASYWDGAVSGATRVASIVGFGSYEDLRSEARREQVARQNREAARSVAESSE